MKIIISLILGIIIGIVLMCLLQINKLKEKAEKENEEVFSNILNNGELSYKAKIVKINDLIDGYRKGRNPFTVLREITNVVKGWNK